MSCRTWISLLVNYFSTIKEIEAQIEEIRLEICQNPYFNPERLFNLIDIDEKNFITLNDLRIYLNNQFIPFEEQCLRRFIHNFSKNENFKISYRDFLGIILPKSNLSIANSIKKKNYSYDNQDNKNDYIIENFFKKLIQLELNLVKTLSQITEQLKNSKDFMIYEAFVAIVKFDKYITSDNLNEFLNEYNININNNDSQNIMFRLDLDGDGKISYEEFISIFYPYKDNYSLSDIQNTKVNKNTFTINDLNKSDFNQSNSNINNYNYQNKQFSTNLSPNYDDEIILNNIKNPTYLNNYNKNTNTFQSNNLIRSNNIINTNTFKSPNNMYSNDNNYKIKNSFIKVNRNPCGHINKLTNSPLSFDYKKGNNKKPRFLSMDNSINDINIGKSNYNNVNISSYYNSMFKNKKSSSLPKNDNYNTNSYNKTNSIISSREINQPIDNSYINKINTYSSPKKQNYNNSLNQSLNEIQNSGRGYFTKSQKYSPNRSHIMTSEIVNLPYPNSMKKKN